jgi:hypothetical protein
MDRKLPCALITNGEHKRVIAALQALFLKNIESSLSKKPIRKITREIDRIHFVYYKRSGGVRPGYIPTSSYVVFDMKQMNRATVSRGAIYCVGCIEDIPQKIQSVFSRRNNILSSSRSVTTSLVPTEVDPHTKRLYLCGFIGARHPSLLSAVSIEPEDNMLINGYIIEDPSLLIQLAHLSPVTNLVELLTTESHSAIDTQPSEYAGSDSLTSNCEEDVRVHLYVFQNDDTPQRHREGEYLKTRTNLHDVIMDRVTMLCRICKALSNISVVSSVLEDDEEEDDDILKSDEGCTTTLYDLLLPLREQDAVLRDRVAIHLLCKIVALSEPLSKWYYDAERVAFSLNMRTFCKAHKDIGLLYNVVNPHLPPIRYDELNPPFYTVEDYTIDEHMKEIEAAIQLNSKQTVDVIPDQLSDLVVKSIKYITEKVDLAGWGTVKSIEDVEEEL